MAGNSFSTAQVTVGATSTLIAARRDGRAAVTVLQTGTTAVYIGASPSVSSSTGIPLLGTAGASITIPASGDVYGIVGAGSQLVGVLESF